MPKRAHSRPHSAPAGPATQPPGPNAPHPPTQRPRGQWAGSRSWVCLILLIGFNFSFASISSGPSGTGGAGERANDAAIFIHSPFPVNLMTLISPPHFPMGRVFACFLPVVGDGLSGTPPLPSPWSPRMWKGGGICLKKYILL